MRPRDFLNIIPLLVFAAVSMVHSNYPVYDPRSRQYGPFEPNYGGNPMGSYMPAPYMNPYPPNPYPNPVPYMNPNPAPYMNAYPPPGLNPYPAPYRNSYPTAYRNPNLADTRQNDFPRHRGVEDPQYGPPGYEDLHALVQHRLPGFFGKHEHRLLWSPDLPYPTGESGFHGQEKPPMHKSPYDAQEQSLQYVMPVGTEPPIPKSPDLPGETGFHGQAKPPMYKSPDLSAEPALHGQANHPMPKSSGQGSNESSSQPMKSEGPKSNGSNSEPVTPEGHAVKKRYVNEPRVPVNDLRNQMYEEFNKTLSLVENFSSDELVKLYIYVLLHPKEFKYREKYAKYIAWIIAQKYDIYVGPSTVFRMYPKFASMGIDGTMKNPLKQDSHRNYHTSYYKEGHVERTGGIDKKLFFGAKGSVYDDPEGGSLGDQRGVSDLV